MDDFDFGVELNEYRYLCDSFPMEGKLLLLLDSDYIPYNVGFCSSEAEYERYLKGDEQILKSKYDHTCYLIKDAMRKSGADSVRLFVTDGSTNFRNTLASYKENRKEKVPPPFFKEMKEYIRSFENVVHSICNEADDMISIWATRYNKGLFDEGVEPTLSQFKLWSPYIIGSPDKDLMQIIGLHCNLKTGEIVFVDELGWLEPKWSTKLINSYEEQEEVIGYYSRGAKKGQPKIKVHKVCTGKKEVEYIKSVKGAGMKFFYAQMLMGDPVDGYYGLEGYGATKTYELLDEAATVQDCHDIVVAEYRYKLGDAWFDHFTLMGRFARMQQEEGQLWTPQS